MADLKKPGDILENITLETVADEMDKMIVRINRNPQPHKVDIIQVRDAIVKWEHVLRMMDKLEKEDSSE